MILLESGIAFESSTLSCHLDAASCNKKLSSAIPYLGVKLLVHAISCSCHKIEIYTLLKLLS